MNPSSSGEGPAILQLHKWDSSYPKLNLSEFSEAFISPTRQQLLLLSRQNEALLLPLLTEGCGVINELKNNCSENVYHSNSAIDPRRDDVPCPSGSVVDFDRGFSFESELLSGRSAFLGDVYSVAWGVCGDTYNQHKDALFREFLFVSGSRGVTVHAFCENTTISRSSETASQGKFELGKWVEWGPSVTLVLNKKEDVNTTNGNSENPQGNEFSRGIDSKLWLQSFLADVEDFESDGKRWTRFPDKSSFPSSAKVVSFHIFDSDFPYKDFVPHSNSLLKECLKEKVHDSGGDGPAKLNSTSSCPSFEPEVLSSSFGVGISSMYKCSRVFSSHSHYVGFALTLVESVSIDKSDESTRCLYRNLVLVAMLDKWAIQWISLVKLEENQNIGPLVEWADFCFFNNLLVALTSSGFVVFYSAMSGEYVVHINILQTCEFKSNMEFCEQDKMSVGAVGKNIEVEKVPSNRVFNKLISASHTSMLAAVDESGVVYVICADQHFVDRDVKLFPHCQHIGLGILAGWEVGGSCICCQRSYSKFSGSQDPSFSSMGSRYHSFLSNGGNHLLHELQQWNLHGKGMQQYTKCSKGFLSAYEMTNQTFHGAVVKPCHLRRIFLPTNRVNKDDFICFSPFGITRLIRKHIMKDQHGSQIVHFNLLMGSTTCDDSDLLMECEMYIHSGRKEYITGDAVGCTFQGCFYLVTESGLSVVLPSVSVSSSFLPIEWIGYRQWSINSGSVYKEKDSMEIRNLRHPSSAWTIEVLDRVLLYDSVEEADRLCIENGWDLKIPRMRRLQLALDYLKFDDIEQCLEMLVGINLAEEGILRLLFAAVYLMLHKSGNDNDVSAASRLLTLASRFATKIIRTYGLLLHENNTYISHTFDWMGVCHLPLLLNDKSQNDVGTARRLGEMANFLEIIRNLQSWLSSKLKRPGQGLVNGGDESGLVPAELSSDESKLAIFSSNTLFLETVNQSDNSFPVSAVGSNYAENLALAHMDVKAQVDSGNLHEVSAIISREGLLQNKILSLENPKEMIARWKIDNLDLKTVVNDALLSGRLPLAVLQLHLYHSRELIPEKEPHDTFNEVRDIGRAIAYDLFLKGETGLAVATLQRLGEDVETSLKELLFGTVRRSLRAQIFDEMKRYGYLGPYEWQIMDRISLIERLYPSSCFWNTYNRRQKEYMRIPASSHSPRKYTLQLLHSNEFNNFTIECGEMDGVVLGSWTNVNENSSVTVVEDENVLGGYWAAASVWCNVWDQRTIDRIVLDQSSVIDVDVLWESQLDYYMSRGDWDRVSKLLDLIPERCLEDGNLQVSLDSPQPALTVGCAMESSMHRDYFSSLEELDAVCMNIPNVKLLKFPTNFRGPTWIKMQMEKKLAEKNIFLKEFWEGTAEMVSLLACAGFVTSRYEFLTNAESVESSSNSNFSDGVAFDFDTVQALHKVVIRYCVQNNLPHLLDLYLDKHMLVLDNGSLSLLLDAAGDCEWAKWLMLSRVKGCEYEASFSNARSVMSRGIVPSTDLLEMDEVIRTVDDIAEGGGELAALATLMHAPVPIQHCLNSGGVKRHSNSSFQCTLENLKPALQSFPTLWRTLVSACFGQDSTSSFVGSRGKNALSDYLSWRDSVFFSSGHDTSLLQMLPCWLPKAVRRLVQIYVQGPLGWQSMSGLPLGETLRHREIDFFVNVDENAEINAISWEATIQKHVEQELCDPTLEETGLGLEHHLHRGRALSSFNRLLSVRIQNFKSEGQSGDSTQGQTNIQSDLQRLLAPLTETEISLLSSVMPLAIMHFEDSILVASCSFLLELCGLSASMLRMDVTALRRISSYYKSNGSNNNQRKFSPNSVSRDGDMVESLARALADDYLHRESVNKPKKTPSLVNGKQSSRALIHVLHHLEKASLPLMVEGKTCGSWLLSGNGNGIELRSQQKSASQHWNLVTVFCQMHQLPLSTKYLAVLARDNDWVGFLSEAQTGGYPFDAVLNVASKEFSNPRLRTHILTVLKGMQSRRKASTSHADNTEKRTETFFSDEQICYPVELFRILAECERQKNPGETLLKKAKDLSWSILAMIASCFSDVSPLSCLTVWLEITAARETSSIKVNDIASQIADNVAAAVKATNSLPIGDKVHTMHYNRRNPKRRCMMGSMPRDTSASASMSTSPMGVQAFPTRDFIVEEERNIELHDTDEGHVSLSKMVAVLCEQQLFLPLLRAFEMFLPSCSFLPFIRALQAFSQMRLSEASAHLGSFSARIKEEPPHMQSNMGREGQIGISWISSMAVKAADAMLLTCPSPYEKRCLLKLLAATDFGDGGSSATQYRQLYWKINLAEPSLRQDELLQLGNETLDDASLLTALEKNGLWDQARNWAKQLEASGGPWKSVGHHVTETQAESMVAEWKEFLWDVPEERVALWGHCQTLFIRYSFPALQAGLFFLKHAEAVEKDLPPRELHELLLLSLQWLSGMITLSSPVYPLNLLREIETKVWLLAVESEAQVKSDGELNLTNSLRDPINKNCSSIIDRTANIIIKMDNHINTSKSRSTEKHEIRESYQGNYKNPSDASFFTTASGTTKTKRRAKGFVTSRRPLLDPVDRSVESDEVPCSLYCKNEMPLHDENVRTGMSFSRWEERVGTAELERAVLSLLEFGQISAAKQLQHKLSPAQVPPEFILVDAALKLAALSTPSEPVSISVLDEEIRLVMHSYNILTVQHQIEPVQVLESLAAIFIEGRGRGLCKRIIAVVKAANVLGLSFSEAFDKQPIELLQLLSLKAQESFEEANLLVKTHPMPAANIAQILAESFLKGLLAAHRGGYMDSQKEEGPAPLLWRFSDFLKWAELCPSEPEIGHALMRMVITGQEIPHACEVELLILSHHFYKSSACLDGVDVLVALAATRVDAYVSEGDFSCLARLITGVGNFHALNFILGILIENGQLDLLLQKYSAATDTNTSAVRGFRMAVLTALKHFNPNDVDAFAMVYNHFDMKHETAALLESRADQSAAQWFGRKDNDQNEDLLDAMRYFIEAAEVHSSLDAGNKARRACAQAFLLSLQIRMPDIQWLYLSETNARRALVEQSRFQEALIVAEAYGLNQPSEWALVLWNQMFKPELLEFVAEFVAVLPLQPAMLTDLAKFYRAELAARGDQSQFSVWLTGGVPGDWAKYMGRSFRCLLRRTRDLKLRHSLAQMATGFSDVINTCNKLLDKVPENAGPLVLKRGHGGAYLPLM